jgi:hypothetical protein
MPENYGPPSVTVRRYRASDVCDVTVVVRSDLSELFSGAQMGALVVPVVVAFTLAVMAGCFAYFVVVLAPVSQSATPEAPPAEVSPSTVGQVQATDTVDVVNRLRPPDEDIAKAFRQATEDRQPVETETQDAVLDADEPPIAGPVPLPKRRPTPRP